jgi:hypothetical protein
MPRTLHANKRPEYHPSNHHTWRFMSGFSLHQQKKTEPLHTAERAKHAI